MSIKKDPPIHNSPSAIRLPILLSCTLVIGIVIGTSFFSGNQAGSNLSKSLSKYREILLLVENNYVDSVDTKDLVEYSIGKMLEKLDPHTSYFNAEEAVAARSQLESGFDGIGIEFNIFNDTVHVVTPLAGGPSEAAGIRSGDKIISVNNEPLSVTGITNNQVFKLLRGKRGTAVKLDIARNGTKELLHFDIKRDRIPTYSIEAAYTDASGTGYIKVSRFSESTYDEFKTALNDLKENGMQRLILDLRGNPGGYMDRATNMLDELISGEKLLVYTKGKERRFDKETRARFEGIFEKGPIIVLIDEGSASASEIMAGALQDHDRALLIGRRTFGKGLVQMPVKLSDNSELRLTISRYYTPSGRSIQKPYELGKGDEYSEELKKRFEHGEFITADSIRFDSLLQFKTQSGRLVYGGGGVMPDIFVPRDTTSSTKLLYELYAKNIIREYAAKYAAKHDKQLLQNSFEHYLNSFTMTEQMLAEMMEQAKQVGISPNAADLKRSRAIIISQTKAMIARNIWGRQRKNLFNNELYQVLNQSDPIVQKALGSFSKAVALEKGELATDTSSQ